jgi:hypothetical protein
MVGEKKRSKQPGEKKREWENCRTSGRLLLILE